MTKFIDIPKITNPSRDPNTITYQGYLEDGRFILTSVKYPAEFVNESGRVVLTCEEAPLKPESIYETK
jgi:hypothetical protein